MKHMVHVLNRPNRASQWEKLCSRDVLCEVKFNALGMDAEFGRDKTDVIKRKAVMQ